MLVMPIQIARSLWGFTNVDCINPHYSYLQKEEKLNSNRQSRDPITYRDIPGYPPELDIRAKFVSHG